MELPLLSRAATFTTTSCELASNLVMPFVFAAGVSCCAGRAIWPAKRIMRRDRIIKFPLESEPQVDGNFPHAGCARGEAVVRGSYDRAPVGDGHLVQHVLRLELKIEAVPLAEPEDAANRSVQREDRRTGNRVAPRGAPESGRGRGKCRRIEQQARRRHGQAGGIGAYRAGHRSPAHLREVASHGRGERVARMYVDVTHQIPVLEELAFPAVEE